jgi:hypothetical protein
MTLKTSFKVITLLSMSGFLVACDQAVAPFVPLSSGAGDDAGVTVITLNTGTATAGSVAATYHYVLDQVSTAGGIPVDPANPLSHDQGLVRYDYVAGLNQGVSGDNRVFALVTDPANLPAGTVTYNGQSRVLVTDNNTSATYTGVMNSAVTANFATALVDVDLDTISNATSVPTGVVPSAPYAGNGNEDVSITGLAITGATFAAGGGTAAAVTGFGNPLNTTDLTGGTISAAGVFAGLNGEEVAGAVGVSGGAGGAVSFTFTGTQ